MFRRSNVGRRWLLPIATLAWFLALSGSAWGWIEKEIESSAVTVEVAPNGQAKIHYSLAVGVRGERLRGLTLQGVDLDASPLPDGTITRIRNGRAVSLPLPVNVISNGGKLEITIPLAKGFAGRHFKLDFGYRTNLLLQGKLRAAKDPRLAALAWTSPHYSNGVDAASVTFLLPSGPVAPSVGLAPEGATFGIVMSNLRRTTSQDELELVRAHLAQGESMIWRTNVDRSVFPLAAAPPTISAAPQTSTITSSEVLQSPNGTRHGLLVVVAGALYALLVSLKSKYVRGASSRHDCTARGLVPWTTPWRALAAGLSLGGAIAATLWTDNSMLASGLLLGAMSLAAHRPPKQVPSLRGGGQWRDVGASELLPTAAPALAGSWLDASRNNGLFVLLVALSATVTAAVYWYAESPYLGASALCGSAAFLPIFCTGLARDLPMQRLIEARLLLSKIYTTLSRERDLLVRPLARYTQADNQLDELRLSVIPQKGITGLMSLEVAVELHDDWAGGQAMPVVLIRAADSSPCYRALPGELSWTRGRSAEERAAIVRPSAPTAPLATDLIRQVLARLQQQQSPAEAPATPQAPSKSQRPQKSRRSSGRPLSAANAGNRASPVHAT